MPIKGCSRHDCAYPCRFEDTWRLGLPLPKRPRRHEHVIRNVPSWGTQKEELLCIAKTCVSTSDDMHVRRTRMVLRRHVASRRTVGKLTKRCVKRMGCHEKWSIQHIVAGTTRTVIVRGRSCTRFDLAMRNLVHARCLTYRFLPRYPPRESIRTTAAKTSLRPRSPKQCNIGGSDIMRCACRCGQVRAGASAFH